MSLPTDNLIVESSETRPRADDFVVIDGNRLVKPYHFDFVCNVRQRWCGQNIVDIFSREFPARDRAYYRTALADGRLRVEGRSIFEDTPLKDGMRMRHFIHRHEPPVPAGPVQVVAETPEVVAVCKPAGMPVHVSGQYRKNTVHGILMAERPDLGDLLPVHRLDKPVSGLLLFARNSKSANALRQKIEGRTVDKVYVARVMGAFPESDTPIVVDVPLSWDPTTNHAYPEPLQPPGSTAGSAGRGDAPASCPPPCSAPAGEGAPLAPTGATLPAGACTAGSTATAAAAGGLPAMHRVSVGTEEEETNGRALPLLEGRGAFVSEGASPPPGPMAQQGKQRHASAGDADHPTPGAGDMQLTAPTQRGQHAQLSAEAQHAAQQALDPLGAEDQDAKRAGHGRRTGKERRAAKRAKLAAAAAAGEQPGQQRGQGRAKAGRGEARPAQTELRLLWVAPDGKTSLVECRPRTGRTHQIRVHLQWLGHPIANDVQYGGTYGGPLPSRHMARQLGVSWDQGRQAGAAVAKGAAAEVAVGTAASHLEGSTSKDGSAPCSDGYPVGEASRNIVQPIGGTVAGADGGESSCNGSAVASAACAVVGAASTAPVTAAAAASGGSPGDRHPSQGDRQGFKQQAEGSLLPGRPQEGTGEASGAWVPPLDVASQDEAFARSQAFRSSPQYEAPPSLRDPLCIHCPYYAPKDYPMDLRPLWLHARTYSCQNGEWSFTTDPPAWALPHYPTS